MSANKISIRDISQLFGHTTLKAQILASAGLRWENNKHSVVQIITAILKQRPGSQEAVENTRDTSECVLERIRLTPLLPDLVVVLQKEH